VRPSVIALTFFCLAASSARAEVRDAASRLAVKLQLRWRHQFQFAGYYVALERGYYRAAGLDVSIEAARPEADAVFEVLNGRAQFGVAASELVRHRLLGRPVVALAAIFQHSPLVLFVRPSAGITAPADLDGKRMMLAPQETEIFAFLSRAAVSVERLTIVPHSFDVSDFAAGKVDAFVGYSTDEPFELDKLGVDYRVMTPQSAGIDFYGDTLFTSTDMVLKHPREVQAFRDASVRGWNDAFADIDATVKLVRERYAPELSEEKLRFEAEAMRGVVQPDVVEIGYSFIARWRKIGADYAALGLSPAPDGLEGFLFEPAQPLTSTWPYVSLAVALGVLFIGGPLGAYIVVLNRRLRQRISEKERTSDALEKSNTDLVVQLKEVNILQEQLRRDALRDSLTGLYNRRYFEETLSRELARAERDNYSISLVLIDIDHFKSVNDRHGHLIGDEVLKEVASQISRQIRVSDVACRYGGEEFVVILPNSPAEAAAARTEDWRDVVTSLRVPSGDTDVSVTFSAGVAAFPRHGRSVKTLLLAADEVLYEAKRAGRNRTIVAGDGAASGPK
jgi:diguanylate cyclase (GGDEF)-like protein